MAVPIVRLIQGFFYLYFAVLLIRVILSWLRTPTYTSRWLPFWNFVYAVTEPLLAPIRRLLMRYQRGTPLDFSPLVLILLLQLAETLIISLVRRYVH